MNSAPPRRHQRAFTAPESVKLPLDAAASPVLESAVAFLFSIFLYSVSQTGEAGNDSLVKVALLIGSLGNQPGCGSANF